MRQPTVDELQLILRKEVFHYAVDGKKAAGRALGTLVELITYYKLRSWGFGPEILIETKVPEFGDPNITHNVEFTLHRVKSKKAFKIPADHLPVSKRALRTAGVPESWIDRSVTILTKDRLLRNSTVLLADEQRVINANVTSYDGAYRTLEVAELETIPRAMFECKRVGVQEGMKRGPQTIEKAKQGAYVARTVSSLQRVSGLNGHRLGFLPQAGKDPLIGDYIELYEAVIRGQVPPPPGFVVTVGVTSNHGNWFTAENMNKELLVLAGAYDYLLFLTDSGLYDFINTMIVSPVGDLTYVGDVFRRSYTGKSNSNRFTKVRVDEQADALLRNFFKNEHDRTDAWFNVLTPADRSVTNLFDDLRSFVGVA